MTDVTKSISSRNIPRSSRCARSTKGAPDLGGPGAKCQLDFGHRGQLADPVTGGSARCRADHPRELIAAPVRVTSLHPDPDGVHRRMRGRLAFFGGLFKVLVPDSAPSIVADADAVNPRFTAGWLVTRRPGL